MLGAFICWICVCVFVASYLRGYRAYAAVLSGYTVAIITVVNIDTPQKVFTTMTDRVAAITIGILCVTLINDVFGSPPVWRGLDRRINDIWHDVRDYARDVLSGSQGGFRKSGSAPSHKSAGVEGPGRYCRSRYGGRAASGGRRTERDAGACRDRPTGSTVDACLSVAIPWP